MAMTGSEVLGQMPAWSDKFINRLGAMKFDSRLPVVVTVLMIFLLAQSLAVLTWDLLPKPEVKDIAVAASSRTLVDQGRNYKAQINQISQWHLFGEAQKEAPLNTSKVTEAPDTRLNLKLLGVMASSDPETARAIIADGKGEENSYGIGKTLPGNAVLREIYTDRVILEYRGRLETLRLPKEAVVIGFTDNSALNQVEDKGVTRRFSNRTTSVSPGIVRNSQTSALLRQYREALINDPQSIMNLVSAAPVNEEGTGKLKGYRIAPGKDKALLRKFGLENGDVVTAVNGVALDNPIKALEIMRDLSNASAVTLDIERKGVTRSLSFQVD